MCLRSNISIFRRNLNILIIERDPVGVSLAGKHTNCLAYLRIPRYLSQQELGVWRVVGGGCGQRGHRNGVPKMG